MIGFTAAATAHSDRSLRALVERQARAWTEGDFAIAAPDWHPAGELIAPGNRVAFADLPRTVRDFHAAYRDLEITVTNLFASAGGDRIALEWLWAVTRRSDGARSATPDAIIVDLDAARIVSWREYFDTANAVEAYHRGDLANG